MLQLDFDFTVLFYHLPKKQVDYFFLNQAFGENSNHLNLMHPAPFLPSLDDCFREN